MRQLRDAAFLQPLQKKRLLADFGRSEMAALGVSVSRRNREFYEALAMGASDRSQRGLQLKEPVVPPENPRPKPPTQPVPPLEKPPPSTPIPRPDPPPYAGDRQQVEAAVRHRRCRGRRLLYRRSGQSSPVDRSGCGGSLPALGLDGDPRPPFSPSPEQPGRGP
jgi:hypothetical protein